jgi:cell division septal protein FtsQ
MDVTGTIERRGQTHSRVAEPDTAKVMFMLVVMVMVIVIVIVVVIVGVMVIVMLMMMESLL